MANLLFFFPFISLKNDFFILVFFFPFSFLLFFLNVSFHFSSFSLFIYLFIYLFLYLFISRLSSCCIFIFVFECEATGSWLSFVCGTEEWSARQAIQVYKHGIAGSHNGLPSPNLFHSRPQFWIYYARLPFHCCFFGWWSEGSSYCDGLLLLLY